MATYLPNVTDVIPEPALFTPNFSFLDTMLRRRQGLYEQGFAQVNSAYNFVNRGVTNPYSVQVRDTFLKQAQQNLKNLSSLDLSQQQNVKMAAGVFEPFVKNRSVLGDMALTAHWDTQEGIAESFRLKDGGKEYSDDNINYVRLQRQAFAKDDISTVGDYYSSRRSFTPYYDWNKEIQDAMKNFKPSSTKIEKINGMYMVTTKDASWTKEEINKYLSATLSDKAKQQMRIEAAVRYPDLNSVAGLYMNQAAQDLPQIEGRVNMMNDALKSEKDETKRKALQEERDFYTERAKEIRGNVENIQKGDVSFLKKNAQRLAENIYVGQTVGRIANGFSHLDVEQTIGFNQVAMMYARMAFDAAENEKTRKADKQELPFLPVQREGEQVTTDLTSLNNKIDSAEKEKRAKFAELKDVIVATDPSFNNKPASSLTQADVDAWLQKNPNSKDALAFANAAAAVEVAKEQKTLWDKDAEKYARDNMGADWTKYEQYLAEKNKVAASMQKPTVDWDPVKSTYVSTSTSATGEPVKRDLGRFYMEPARQDATSVRNSQLALQLQTLPQRVASTNTGLSLKEGMALDNRYRTLKNEFNSKRNTLSSVYKSGFTMNVTDPRYKNTKGYLEAVTGLEGKVSGISWFPSATDYQIEFKLDDANASNPVDRTKVTESLKQRLGTNDVKYNEATDMFTVGKIGPTVAPRLDPFNGVDPLHRQVLSNLEVFSGQPGSARTSTEFHIAGTAGINTFQIKKLFGNTEATNKYILLVNNMPINNTFGSTLEAYSTAFGLSNNPAALSTILNAK
jgi:hypothetical protein